MKAAQVSGDAIVHYKRTVPGKRALCFAWSIEASIELAGRFNAEGIPAAHVDGTTPSLLRDSIVRDFVAGKIKVITNVDVFSEGVDLPAIEALFMLRPTASLARYLQMVGRALRTHPGKECCWIFDHANNASSGGHGFPDDAREWTLDGKKKKKKQESDGPLCRTCPNCFETHPLHVRICPCGYQLVMEREVEVDADAQLVEIDPAVARRQRMMEQGKADSLEALTKVGRARGMKHPDLWAKFVLKAREDKKLARERVRQESLSFIPPKEIVSPGVDVDPWAF
jgi:DNA repair protein RadD